MWMCPKCGKRVKDSLELCWNCGASGRAVEGSDSRRQPDSPPESDSRREPDSQREPDLEYDVGLQPGPDAEHEGDLPPGPDSQQEVGLQQEADLLQDPDFQEWLASRRGTDRPQLQTRQVAFRHFRDRWKSWEDLFQEAAQFAGTVGPERLISISHSADQGDGVVTVWYWAD